MFRPFIISNPAWQLSSRNMDDYLNSLKEAREETHKALQLGATDLPGDEIGPRITDFFKTGLTNLKSII